ncbi:hypothetical protein, partial [Pseudomonas mosselii]|uniref:hypothetical protein n=1 Tax=Pseudomonas mosselii TaxID=78327 RepID=UPI003D2DAB8B
VRLNPSLFAVKNLRKPQNGLTSQFAGETERLLWKYMEVPAHKACVRAVGILQEAHEGFF